MVFIYTHSGWSELGREYDYTEEKSKKERANNHA
jgi:hypothetical protein